jgi:chromosome partitioning protein
MLGQISQGLLKWQASRSLDRTSRATTVAVCSRKGGVGKTTTSVHLAVAAARWHFKRVLIVDLDPQGHVIRALSSMVRRESAQSLSSVFMAKKGDVLDACIPTDIPNLWVVPADDQLEQAQMFLSSRIGREFILKTALRKAEDMFDLIVFDCPPNLDTLTSNALVAAGQVLIPTDLSLLAIEGVADIADAVETVRERLGLSIEISGIVVSRVDGRNKTINRELLKMLDMRFGSLVMDSRVASNTAVPRACLQGLTVFDFDPGSKAAAGFKQVTQELFDRVDS